MNDFTTVIESITESLLHHLPLLIAISFIVVKLVLIRLSGHKEDQWRAILTIPEDVSYAALGLIIAGLSGDIPAFHAHFEHISVHPRDDMWTLFACGIFVCYVVHLIHQHGVTPNYQGWAAADALIIEAEESNRVHKPVVRKYTSVYYMRYAGMLVCLLIEGLLSYWWISHVAEIIEKH
jgi:cellobiose-specific phosphotransferase system component IIC